MPVYNSNPLTPEIQEILNTMASTDILQTIQTLESLASQTQQNKDALLSQGVTLTSVVASATVIKDFVIPKTAFVLNADGFYYAPIAHDLGSESPIVATYDNGSDGKGRDLQLVQVQSDGPDDSKIKLTASQWNDNDFPLHCKFQARNVVAPMTIGDWKKQPLSDRYYRLLSGTVDRSADGSTVENPGLLSAITEAFMSGQNQLIYWKNSGGQTGFIDNGSLGNGPTAISMADFDSFKALPDSIVL